MDRSGDRERSGAEAHLAIVQYVTEGALLRLEPEESLLEMLERVQGGIGADAATLRRLVPATDSAPAMLHHHASVGMDPAVGPAVDLPLGSGLAGRVAEQVEPLLVTDISADGRASPHLTAHGMQSMAGVPACR